VTGLDLAAIKTRADAAVGYATQSRWRKSAQDVPALLARIAELEAQRDELLAYPPKMLKGELAAAERRGYERAVTRLRDDERREAWLLDLAEREQLANRPPFVQDLADYLDAVKETL